MSGRLDRVRVALALVVVASVLTLGHAFVRAQTPTAEIYCAGPAETQMLAAINDFRAGRGLDPLRLSEPLGAAAEHKSEEMASQGYFAHTSPAGVTPRDLVQAFGYEPNTAIGENLAAGHEDAAATFAQWRDSAPHREILLDADFHAIGIGRAYDVASRFDWYWTAEFGGVLAQPAAPCKPGPTASPAATPPPGQPLHLMCDGVRRSDGTYALTCRAA